MSKAPLAAAQLSRLDAAMRMPFAISRGSHDVATVALVRLRDADGLEGLGEAAPFPSLTHDTVESALPAARHLAEALIGKTTEQALEALPALREATTRTSITAFVGVELALWDLHAKQRGVSLASLWGSAGLASVTTDITLPLMPPAAVAGFWRTFAGYGFETVKIKVSGRVEDDRAMIQALLRELPPGLTLTLDGNQGFTPDAALALVARLAQDGVRPAFFEQPLPEDDLSGCARLAKELPIPVCLDETVRTAAAARRVVEGKLARIINVKLMKSGVAEAREIVRVAQAAGLELMIGGMLETEVAMGASLQLACGTGAFRHVDLDTPFFLSEPVTRESPWHARRASLLRPSGAGHGLATS